jgi:hypothetical protein
MPIWLGVGRSPDRLSNGPESPGPLLFRGQPPSSGGAPPQARPTSPGRAQARPTATSRQDEEVSAELWSSHAACRSSSTARRPPLSSCCAWHACAPARLAPLLCLPAPVAMTRAPSPKHVGTRSPPSLPSALPPLQVKAAQAHSASLLSPSCCLLLQAQSQGGEPGRRRRRRRKHALSLLPSSRGTHCPLPSPSPSQHASPPC